MKILTISNTPLDESLGSGYVVVNYARGLRERGHEVDAFGPDAYEPFRSMRLGTGYRKALGMLWLALRQLVRFKYDIVEFYGAESWLAILILGRMPHRSFLIVHHSNGLETHFLEEINRYIESSTMDGKPRRWYQVDATPLFEQSFIRADAIVMVSRFDAEYAREHAYQNDARLLYIENPLPDSYIGADVNLDREAIVGFCGSWLTLKGKDVLLADLPRLLDDFGHVRLRIVGVGPRFRKEDHFPDRVCPRIDVIPFVQDKSELQRIYQSISILVAPSYYESFGLVVAEAMANGCAVIASRVGFAAHLEDRREVMLFAEPLSPHVYERASELLVDDRLRIRVARAGYERVQSLTWECGINALEQFYMACLNEIRSARELAVA